MRPQPGAKGPAGTYRGWNRRGTSVCTLGRSERARRAIAFLVAYSNGRLSNNIIDRGRCRRSRRRNGVPSANVRGKTERTTNGAPTKVHAKLTGVDRRDHDAKPAPNLAGRGWDRPAVVLRGTQ